MAQRSRKRGQRAAPPPQPPGSKPPSRTELRNAEARAQLQPLAPGERPGPVTVAAIAAAVLGVLNVTLYLAGVRVRHTTFAGTVLLGVVLLMAAVGMWRVRYWAVLGFQTLLAVTCVIASLSLFLASNVTGAVRAVLVIGSSGTLFWKLVGAMARIQMPERRAPQ
ncbi:MAG TPA: hypothetical protein VE972_07095 [Conexibacter sp.]|nr:hypothetical protein [Conexibacter sp.]